MKLKSSLVLPVIALATIAAAIVFARVEFDPASPPDAAAAAHDSADTAIAAPDAPADIPAAVPAEARNRATLLVIGDSLSAGYGLESRDSSWVGLLEKRLQSKGYEFDVVNASISGDTSEGGRARLSRALERLSPEIVVLELGGNDGLRGIPLEVMEQNFAQMITESRAAGAAVVLLGMRIPPNYGPRYAERFHALYGELADRYDVPLAPFFMEDVALDPNLMQADGIHPTEAAQPLMLERAWPAIEIALKRVSDNG
jgi:acyl-CoA thioesterase-1